MENVAAFTDRYAAITRHLERRQCVHSAVRRESRWIRAGGSRGRADPRVDFPAIIPGLFVTIRKENSRRWKFKRQRRLSGTVTIIFLYSFNGG